MISDKKAYRALLLNQIKDDFVQGKYSEGTEALLEIQGSLAELKDEEEIEILIQFYSLLLVGLAAKGEFREALTYGSKALEDTRQLERPELKVKVLLHIADLYVLIQAYEKAEAILESIVPMAPILMDTLKIELEMAWRNVYLHQNQLERAAEHCKKAYDLAKKNETHYELELLRILILRAELNVARQLYTQAEKDLTKVAQRLKNKPFKLIEEKSVLIRAKLNQKQGYSREAAQELEAIIANKEVPYWLINESYKVLSEVYEAQKEWNRAYEYLKKYERYQEELIALSSAKELNEPIEMTINKAFEVHQLHYQGMGILGKIGKTLAEELSEGVISDNLHNQLSTLFKMDLLSILLIDEESPCYHLLDDQGSPINDQKELMRNMTYLADYAVRERSSICVGNGDFEAYHIRAMDDEDKSKVQSLLLTPIVVGSKAVGSIGIGSYQVNHFNGNDLRMLEIVAAYLGIRVQNTDLYKESIYLKSHDFLTGVLNRSALLKQGEVLFKANHKKHKSTVVMLVDVDALSQVNERYGYEVGDQVLRKVGELLKGAIGKEHYVGRYNGEEFLILLDNLSEKEVIKVCQKIKKAVHETLFEVRKDKQIKVTISAGFYICNEYTLHFSDAIQFADHALYRAKLLGKNHIVSYTLGENYS